MDHARKQKPSRVLYSSVVLVETLTFINLLVPFADMWDIKLPGPRAIPEYSAEQPG